MEGSLEDSKRSFRNEEDEVQRRADDRGREAARSRALGPGLARELGISDQTLYNWRAKYSGLEVNEARRLRALEDENRRLKTMVADLSLDKEALKAVIRKNGWSL